MTGERTQQALSRITAALARIEGAGPRAAQAAGDQARRHDALRQAVAETLHDLDLLISSDPAGDGSMGDGSMGDGA